MLISDVKTYFQNHEHVDNYSDTVFVDWLKLVNRISYRVLYQNNPNYISESNLVTLSDTSTQYSISSIFGVSDFGNLDMSIAGLYEYSNNENCKLKKTQPFSNELGYYEKSGNIFITGEYEKDKPSVKLAYVPASNPITSLTDTLNIPDKYIHWVSSMVKELYNLYDDRDAYDISYSEQIEKSFRNEMLDSESSYRNDVINTSFDIFG